MKITIKPPQNFLFPMTVKWTLNKHTCEHTYMCFIDLYYCGGDKIGIDGINGIMIHFISLMLRAHKLRSPSSNSRWHVNGCHVD